MGRLLGGHSARLGGAQGLRIVHIELMARRVSPMILHYAKSASLTHITEDYEKLKSERELHRRLDELANNLEALKSSSREDSASLGTGASCCRGPP